MYDGCQHAVDVCIANPPVRGICCFGRGGFDSLYGGVGLAPGASNLLPEAKAKSPKNSRQIYFTNAIENFVNEESRGPKISNSHEF